MFEAGLLGTIEDVVLGVGNTLERGGYAISEMFRGSSSTKESESKEDSDIDNDLIMKFARDRFNNLGEVVARDDNQFMPSFDDFIEKYFHIKQKTTTHAQELAIVMMSNDDTYSEMVKNIAEFFEVSEDLVEQKISDTRKKSTKKLNGTTNISIDFDATDYIKEGEDIMKILMDIDAGKIDALKGIDMIKSMSNNNVTLDIGKFIADIETRVRNASKEETRIEPASLPDVNDKKTVNLREAVESTPLGKRLFTNVEPEVVTV